MVDIRKREEILVRLEAGEVLRRDTEGWYFDNPGKGITTIDGRIVGPLLKKSTRLLEEVQAAKGDRAAYRLTKKGEPDAR